MIKLLRDYIVLTILTIAFICGISGIAILAKGSESDFHDNKKFLFGVFISLFSIILIIGLAILVRR